MNATISIVKRHRYLQDSGNVSTETNIYFKYLLHKHSICNFVFEIRMFKVRTWSITYYKIETIGLEVQLSFGISVIDMEQNMSNNILNYLFLAELKPFLFVIDFSQDRIISLFPKRSTIQHRLVNKRFTFSGGNYQ